MLNSAKIVHPRPGCLSASVDYLGGGSLRTSLSVPMQWHAQLSEIVHPRPRRLSQSNPGHSSSSKVLTCIHIFSGLAQVRAPPFSVQILMIDFYSCARFHSSTHPPPSSTHINIYIYPSLAALYTSLPFVPQGLQTLTSVWRGEGVSVHLTL
ncbi:hypothetical protein B0H10DRAFT_2200718 [Mycena sp. CBHHK59/15]|nr:hypothetical protein B0H10DRAFT_2200718 [Mycena sp. CBHHK59/15]